MKTGKGHKSKSYSRRRSQKGQVNFLPWALGVSAVLIVVLMVYNVLRKPGTDEPGSRSYEVLYGVQGTSMSIGETVNAYPDPGNLGEGQKWLPALGDPEAPVTIIEFSDLFCGHCRIFNLENLEGIIDDYVVKGKVRYVDHFFGFANTLQLGAIDALMCAAEQGHYFEYKHALFQAIDVDAFDLQRGARISGLEMGEFNQCVKSGRYTAAVQEMVFENDMGVSGTPTFFINGESVVGNRPDEIRQKIEKILANTGG